MPTSVHPAQAKELVRSYLRKHPAEQLRTLDVAKVADDLKIPVARVAEARESLLEDEHARLEGTRKKTKTLRAATEGTDPETGIQGGMPPGPWSVKEGLASLVGLGKKRSRRPAPSIAPKNAASPEKTPSIAPLEVPELIRPKHDPKLIEALEKKLGPVVDIDQAPAIYRACQQLLVELAPFWQAKTEQSGTATFLLVDSPLAVAHVDTREDRGVDVVANTVCLSTGLIRSLLGLEALGDARRRQPDPDRLAQGMQALAGLIAQRLACAVKTAEKTADRIPDYQWARIEPFWADTQAALGLRSLGLDPEGVLLAVKLFDMPESCYPSERDAGFKGWLAHPSEKPLREASLELLYTRLGTEPGATSPKRTPGVEHATAIAGELRGLTGTEQRLHLDTYASVSELVDQGLLPLFLEDSPLSHDERTLLFNRRLQDLLDRVAGAGIDPPPQDVEAFQRFLGRWIQQSRGPQLFANAKDAGEKLTAARLAQEYANKPTYAEQLERLPGFRSEGHLAWCREIVKGDHEVIRGLVKRAIEDRAPPPEPEAPRAAPLSPREQQHIEVLLHEMKRRGMRPEEGLRYLPPTDQHLLAKVLGPQRQPVRRPVDWLSACESFGRFVTKLAHLLPPEAAMQAFGESLVSFMKELPAAHRQSLFGYTRFTGPNAADLKNRVYLAWLDQAWDALDGPTRLDLLRFRASDLLSGAAAITQEAPKTQADQDMRAQYDRLLRRIWEDPQRLSFALTCAVPWDRVARANRLELKEIQRSLRAELASSLESPTSAALVGLTTPERASGPRVPRSVADWIDPATATRCLQAACTPGPEHPARALLLDLAQAGFAAAPKEASRALETVLSAALAAQPRPISGEAFCQLIDGIMPRQGSLPMFPSALSVPAKVIERAQLTSEESSHLLAACYAAPRLLSNGSVAEIRPVAEALVEAGVIPSSAHLLARVYHALSRHAEGAQPNAREGYEQSLRRFARDLASLLHRQIADVRSAGELMELGRLLFAADPDAAAPVLGMPNDVEGRELKAALTAAAVRVDLPLADRIVLFMRLTVSGSSRETDQFYQQHILPLLSSKGPLSDDVVKRHAPRLVGEDAKAAFARAVVEPMVAALETSVESRRAAFEIVNRATELAGDRSAARDALLEEIAERLRLDGKVLRGLIHERKSRGRHDPEPFFFEARESSRHGFHFNDYVAASSRGELEDFLAALVSSDPAKLRAHFQRETERYLAAESWRSQKTYDDSYAARKEANLSASLAEDRLAPILTVLRALEKSADDRSVLIRDVLSRPLLLGLADGGREQVFLEAMLDTLPSYQQTVVLARLLAERASVDDLRSSLVDLGTSFGLDQALSCHVLGLDADKTPLKPRGLFSPPLTRWELSSTAERELAPAEWGRVGKILSAESHGPERTRVETVLKDGAPATLEVSTPRTAGQLEEAAARRRAFLESLAARGVELPAELTRAPALPDAPSEPVTIVDLRQRTTPARTPQGVATPKKAVKPVEASPKEVYARDLKDIEQQIGPVLEPTDAPILHGVLERLFAEAIPGQERALDRAFVGQLFIIDSTVPTAFTKPIQKTGSMESLIFVTTGLLRQLMGIEPAWERTPRDAEFPQIEAAMHWAAGITEHELKHAVYQSEGKSRANRFETSQAEEIEVDSRAAYELYADPVRSTRATGVLDGLATFRQGGGADRGARLLWRVLGEAARSHPEMEGRMVFQRLFLTGLRVELGPEMEKGNVITPEEASGMVAELRRQTAAVERETFVFPESIEEATGRLAALLDNQMPKNGKLELELNRVLLALNELLRRSEESGREVSPSEIQAIHRTFEVWSGRRMSSQAQRFEDTKDRPPYEPFDHHQVRDGMNGENLSAELSRLPCHAVSLSHRAFYRSAEHEAWCEQRFRPALKAILDRVPPGSDVLADDKLETSKLGRLLMEISLFMPPDRAATFFGETLLAHPRLQSSPLLAARVLEGTNRYTSFGGIQPRLFMQLTKRAWPSLTREARAELLHDFSAGLFPVEKRPYGMRPVGKQTWRELFLGPDKEQMRTDYDWLLREIWADKELFALTAEIPWDALIERLPDLGLGPDQARGRIRTGVRAVLGNDHQDPKVAERAAETLALLAKPDRKVRLPTSSRFWADKTMLPYFSGEKRAPDKPPGEIYQQLTISNFENQPELLRSYVIEHLARDLARDPGVLGADPKPRLLAFDRIVARYRALEGRSFDQRHQHDLVAEALVSSSLPRGTKAQLLEQYYHHRDSSWQTSDSPAERARIFSRLVEVGVFESAVEGVTFARRAFPSSREDVATWRAQRLAKVAQDTSCTDPESYFKFVESVSDAALAELRALDPAVAQGRLSLLELSGALDVRNFPRPPPRPTRDRYEEDSPKEPKLASTNASRLRALKAAICEAAAAREDLDTDTKLEMFRAITSGGATRDTDLFFLGHILPAYAGRPDDLKAFLDADSVYSHKTRLTLVKEVLAPRIDELAAQAEREGDRRSENLRRAIFELFRDLERYVPDTSHDKDQYLESLGIRLGLRGKDLKGLVEDRKSFNWRRPNPALVNLGTAVSGYIKSLGGKDRESFLQCVMNPTIESVRRETKKVTDKLCPDRDTGRDWLQQLAVNNAGEAERKIETLLLDAGPLERIPLVALTLDTGDGAFLKKPGGPLEVIREPSLLGWDPESLEGILLRSYLESVDPHEVSASLAYMLAHKHESSGEGGSSQVKRLFLVFQTMGIKIGQAAAIFSLFGPRIAKEVDDLKDQARDVSLYEAYQTLDAAKAQVQERLKGAYRLPPAERAQLEQEQEAWNKVARIVAPLGSASGKSVWQVELTDGRMVAMALRRARIEAQIAGNTRLLNRFLDKLEMRLESQGEELKKRGVEFPVAFVRALVGAFQNQLSREFDFGTESQNIEKAAAYFERMDRDFAPELRGDSASEKYKLSVPRVLADLPRTEDILFMELAEGSTLAALERRGEWAVADHPVAGEVMVGSCLRGFFREGRAFPDQHKGNWILSGLKQMSDFEGRELFALDFGQYEEMRTDRLRLDDRVIGGLFLEALPREGHPGKPEQLVEMAMRMSQNPRSVDRGAATREIRELFARAAAEAKAAHGTPRGAPADEAGPSVLSGLVAETLKVLSRSRFDFEDRFLVGFFKGLMVLYGERYVDDATFRRILGDEISRLTRSHPGAVANLIKQTVWRALS